MTEPILFYSTRGEFGGFSNFARYPVKLWGKTWATSEHAYQAAKFAEDTHHYTDVYKAKGPAAAAEIGRDRSRPLRKDWEHVKESAMYEVLRALITACENIALDPLVSADARALIERGKAEAEGTVD